MKVFKKVLSVIMAAVMMLCAVPITAVAAVEEPTIKVDGFDNKDGYYCVRFDGLKENHYATLYYNAIRTVYYALIEIRFKVGNDVYLLQGMYDTLGEKEIKGALLTVNGKEADVKIDGRFYNNTSSGGDYGYVFFIPDGKYVDIITSCTSAEIGFGFDSILSGYERIDWLGKEYKYKTVNTSFEKEDTSSRDISSLKITAPNSQSYTGKAKTPDVTIKDGNYTLKKGTDYTLTYKNNKKIGKATVTIKGKGKYSGEKAVTFKIVPKKPTLKVKKGATKATLTWSEVKGAEKYQIYYSVNGGKYKKLTTTSKLTKTVKGLDFSKNIYKFKVRAIAEGGDGKTYTGSFSKVVTVKKG